MPQISVIVPVYKVDQYLDRCVGSILSQTFRDFELILVDDGSPDGCPAICDEYAAKDSRVIVIHQENGGLSAARNTGIDWVFAHSDSQWLTFVDSDDWIHPEMLEYLLMMVSDLNVNVSVCDYVRTAGEEPVAVSKDWMAQYCKPEDFFVHNNINAVVAWGKLYRSACFRTIRYPVGKLHEDEYTTYKILFQQEAIAVTNRPMYYYFVNPVGITKSQRTLKRVQMMFDALAEQIGYFEEHHFPDARYTAISSYYLRLYEIGKKVSMTDPEGIPIMLFIWREKVRIARQMTKRQRVLIYKTEFPRIMECYWRAGSAVKKIRRNGLAAFFRK